MVPVLQTPELGEVAAKFMCDKLGIASQKEVEKLKEAHDACYTAGFYKGVMTAGPFAGLPVHEAKLKTKAKMVADGEAITYLEPEGLVTPRSTPDVECVVALVDQWYLKYGEEEWAARVGEHLGGLECYNPAVHKAHSPLREEWSHRCSLSPSRDRGLSMIGCNLCSHHTV